LSEGSLSTLLTLAILIAMHGMLEFAFAALSNSRRVPLQERAEDGDTSARRALALSDDLLRLRMAADLLRLIFRFTIAAVATLGFAIPLVTESNALDPAAEIALTLIPTALVSFILGGVLPSALGSAYADRAVRWVAPLMSILLVLLRPALAVLVAINQGMIRLAGSEGLGKSVTEEEIMTLVNVGQQGGTIEDDEKAMIYSVLQFNETIAREVMVPRPDIVSVEIDTPLEKALSEFIRSGHSRIPVYEDNIDNVRGILYAKDLLMLLADMVKKDPNAARAPIRELMRTAYFVPETKRADALFKEMQDRKVHIAIIVDEYGGTAGLLTIEDLIEEIVGDIRDEFDFNEEAEYVQLGEEEYIVDGSMNLDDLEELLGVELPQDDNDSVGGLIYSRLERVPQIGDTVTLDEERLILRVTLVQDRRIRKVHIKRLPPPPETEQDAREDSKPALIRSRRKPSEVNDELPSGVHAAN
jgi:CBS domain containing-hemolysin-like protein